MPFTLNGADLKSCFASIPRRGIWLAHVGIADSLELAKGAAIALVLGDLELVGVVLDGGTFGGESSYVVHGGAGGWARSVPARAYRDDDGIQLGAVAPDLAAEAGEKMTVETDAARVLGYAWTRIAGGASSALRQLVGASWWVAEDGVTHVGARPEAAVPASLAFTVEAFDPTRRRARISLESDGVAAFLPGATFTADSIPGLFTVAGLDVRVRPGSVIVEVIG